MAEDVRHFASWAASHKRIDTDTTFGIRVRVPKSDGFHSWSEDEIAAFEACHAIGSKARLALALGLYTAQRRGDVVGIGRQHIRNGVLTVRQQKTGVTLSIHSELVRTALTAPTLSVSNSACGATKPDRRITVPTMVCAKPHADASPRPAARRTRSPLAACHVEGSRALHEGCRSGAHGPCRHGAEGSPRA